jgi:CRISPR-associated protein Csb2
MPSYFCLSVIFLDPEFHGRRDGDKPEWPPSPLRLFQALVVAAAARWNERMRLAYAVPALNWLAEQRPPTIVAPEGREGASFRLSVPNNAMDIVARAWTRGNYSNKGDANPATHRAMKTVQPTRIPDGAAVLYLWDLPDPLPDGVRGHIEVLSGAARSLVALGWGIDLVAGNGRVISAEEADRIRGERWQPTADPVADRLRVPTPGTLEALTSRHESFLNRLGGGGFTPVPALSTFDVIGYRRAMTPAARPFAAFAFYQPDANAMRAFSVMRAAAVASMVRGLTAAAASAAGTGP